MVNVSFVLRLDQKWMPEISFLSTADQIKE